MTSWIENKWVYTTAKVQKHLFVWSNVQDTITILYVMEYTRPLWALTFSQSDTENCTVCKICYQCFLPGKIQLIYTQKEIKLQQNKYMNLKYTMNVRPFTSTITLNPWHRRRNRGWGLNSDPLIFFGGGCKFKHSYNYYPFFGLSRFLISLPPPTPASYLLQAPLHSVWYPTLFSNYFLNWS